MLEDSLHHYGCARVVWVSPCDSTIGESTPVYAALVREWNEVISARRQILPLARSSSSPTCTVSSPATA